MTDDLPIMLQAWRTAYDEKNPGAVVPPKLMAYLEEKDPVARKEMTREIHEFLHAQQLCALTLQLTDIKRSLDVMKTDLGRIDPLPQNPGKLKTVFFGFFFLGIGFAVGTYFFRGNK